ncbi:MAG: hypothetical protein IKV16_02225 [Clostridia bacterium]|nr:hypothetical protein [Clostridia bacterium]
MRSLKHLLIISLMLICALILSACTFAVGGNTTCQSCVDADQNGFCDVCAKTVLPKKPPHTECIDSDGNGRCDECGKFSSDFEEKDPHTECIDEDTDGECDVCGGKVDLPEPPEPEEPPVHTECIDTNTDGKCDVCEKVLEVEVEESLVLIDKRQLKFSFVISSSVSGDVQLKISQLIKQLSNLGYTVPKYTDSPDNITDTVEVLVGTVTSRGEKYEIDGRDYGSSGYAVKMIENKIIIAAGSDQSLIGAIDYFATSVIGITDTTKNLSSAEFLESEQIEHFHEYRISSVTVGGRDIDGYVIAVDKSDTILSSLAKEIRDKLYSYAGYYPEIVDISTASVDDRYISLAHTDKSGGEGFYVRLSGTNLEISSEFSNKTGESVSSYLLKMLSGKDGAVALTEYTLNTRDVYYEDFGAVGDGFTDDFAAIRNTHTHANKYGHTVVARDGAQYYIGPTPRYVTVNTSVVWGNATFIIDDRNIDPTDSTYNINVFYFSSTLQSTVFTPESCEVIRQINESGGIDAETVTKLDLGLGYPAMLEVYNKNHKVYIRTHLVNDGNDQYELVQIDAEGNIDPTTRFLLDYEEITSIVVRRLDEAPITIDGGHFITRVPQLSEHCQTYMSRGVVLSRANVTVKNFTHEVTDENDDAGCPYAGFLSTHRGAYNIVVDSCSFMSHKTYNVINANGVRTNMGTYDISLQHSNNILFKNCTQPNFFEDEAEKLPYFAPDRWGIMGSNYSKNIRYENCRLSRLDAHCGVYNVSLKDCEVVYISVVGGGTLTVEDTIVYNDSLIQLRGDYGSTWKGDIVVKNVTLHNIGDAVFYNAYWTNHNYGYTTYFPKNLTIDGLKIYRGNSIAIFQSGIVNAGDIGAEYYGEVKNENPMVPPERIVIKNNTENIEFIVPNSGYFKNLVVIEE